MGQSTRQTAYGSLNQALHSLSEVSTTILGAAVCLHRRLLGKEKELMRACDSVSGGEKLEIPLLSDIEARLRDCLAQVREANDIISAIGAELS